MSILLDNILFALSVTSPIFIVLLTGIYLKRIDFINDAFINISAKIVFNIGLPTLLFLSILKTPLDNPRSLSLVIYAALATVFVFVLLEWWAKRLQPVEDRGVFVQGAFRSNMGFIGLAYCMNAYGDDVLSVAGLYLGLITIVFNILAVITLSRSLHAQTKPLGMLKGIAKNPLIIAIVAALACSLLHIPVPEFAQKSGQYFANLAVPLALLSTGGSLNFKELQANPNKTLYATVAKLLIVPVIITSGGVLFGFRGMELGVLFLMSSAPSAAAGYAMVQAMGGNGKLSANIIALTTIFSIVSVSLGITALKSMGWM